MASFRSAIQYTGVALVLAGFGVDAGYHLWWSGSPGLDGIGLVGHLVTLAGMVLTMLAVVAAGLHRPAGPSRPKGELDDACRRPSAA